MSTNKNFDRICAFVMAAALILTVLFMNGTSLGLTAVVDEDAESYTGDDNFTENDQKADWAETISSGLLTTITLEGDTASVSGQGAYVNGSQVVIKNGGYYLISGELTDGSILVDTYKSSKVWIQFDNVDIVSSDGPALIVEQAEKVFLTLKEGTENSLKDSAAYSDENTEAGMNAALFSREDLTINGSGSLMVEGLYKHGIVCKDDLVIAGGSIDVTAVQDGLHANDSIRVTSADLTVEAGDDAVHCDTRIYWLDGTLLISACYEGLEAPEIEILDGDLTIHAEDDGINANGGSSTFGAGGMGGMGAMHMERETFTGEEAVGDGEAPAGEAGFAATAESGEAAAVPESGADETAEADEDTDSETAEEETSILTISGGTITIINENGRDADGIDSNGDLIINGGTILVSMNNSGNNALDYGSENGGRLLINGGIVAAAGSSSMLEEVSEESGQCSITCVTDEVAAGTVVEVTDADGEIVLSQEIPGSFSSLILSSPDLVLNETYTVTLGDISEEAVLDTVNTRIGESTGGTGGGQMPGGDMGGEMPDFESMSEGEFDFSQMGPQGGGRPQNGGSQQPQESSEAQDDGTQETQPQESSEAQNSRAQETQPQESSETQDSGTQDSEVQVVRPQGSEDQASQTGDSSEVQAGAAQDIESMSEGGFDFSQMQGGGQMQDDQMAQGPGGGMGQDRMEQDAEQQEEEAGSGESLSSFGTDTWMLLGGSAVCLLAGLLFAGLYKRKR